MASLARAGGLPSLAEIRRDKTWYRNRQQDGEPKEGVASVPIAHTDGRWWSWSSTPPSGPEERRPGLSREGPGRALLRDLGVLRAKGGT